MLWYICFFCAVLIAVVIGRIAFDRRLGGTRMIFVMLGCLVITYLLYLPPFLGGYQILAALLGCLINAMQVISLDADYLSFYGQIVDALHGGLFAGLYFFFLAAMHFLLPVVSAMTAVTLVVRCLAQIRLGLIKRHKKPLHVFSQVNYRSVILARDIFQKEKKCDILFLDDPGGNDVSDLQRELRCVVLNAGTGELRADAGKRQVYYYCISEDPEQNLADALALLSALEGEKREVQENNHIFLFSADQSTELLIDSIQKGYVNISLINEHRTAAYDLLERYPLTRYASGKDIHVLIFGFAAMGEAVLRAVSWCGQLYGYRLRISVVGRDIRDRAADFQAACPGLFTDRYRIAFWSYQNELELRRILEDHCADANYVVTACGGEGETIDKAVFLRRFFYRTDPKFRNAPPVFAYLENSDKAQAVAALVTAEAKPARRMPYEITPFGMAAQLYSFRNISDSDIEKLSKNVHLVYEDIFSEGEIDVAAALRAYNLFEVNKSSNRANALHIRYKLAMLGLDYTDDPDAEEVDLEAYLTEERLEELTYAEHDRWMAFLESEGWEASTLEQANAYKDAGISKGRHNCPLLKLHPYICPFEELKDRSDGLGLPDSTVYDRELIRRIPDILHDRWNVSGKRYKIVKLQSE